MGAHDKGLIYDASGRGVASLQRWDDFDPEPTAHVIAASPDMLAALRTVRDEGRCEQCGLSDKDHGDVFHAYKPRSPYLVGVVNAAIKLAETGKRSP